MSDLNPKETRARRDLGLFTVVFASYVDGRSGPTHRTLAGAYQCKKPRERLINRRMIRAIKNTRYIVASDGAAIVLIAPAHKPKRRSFARLTPDQVREVRASWADGESQADIARRMHISAGTISQILSGKTYRWVK